MSFKNFYKVNQKIDFDNMNKSLFEVLRDFSINSRTKKDINKFLLMTDDELSSTGFFDKYQHLK